MPDPSTALNEREFSHQAATFADSRYNQVLTRESDWVFSRLPRSARDVVLDVAAGTGLGGRAIAADVRQVIALDSTEAMLLTGARESQASGVTNIVFMRGDAAQLPFLDDSFDVVLCRYALHHLPTPERQLAEIKRVLKPRGWFGLADLIASEDPATAALQNRIERLRDPSHARAWSASELQDRVVRSGFEVAGLETREIRRPLDLWLEQTMTPPARRREITQLLESELEGGAPTGLAPQRQAGGELSFVHTLTSLMVLNRDAR